MKEYFANLLRVKEIEANKYLQYVYWALIVGFLFSFQTLMNHKIGDLSKISNMSYVCPTYFRTCEQFYFLNFLPNGYSGNLFYAFLFSLITLSVFFGAKGSWFKSILFIIPPTIWKVWATFFLEDRISVPFEYFHIGFLLVLLFSKNKFNSLKHTLVIMYFVSALVKVHDAWIVGTYFSTLNLGLPLFHDSLIPFATNFIVLLELFTPILLLSRNHRIKSIALYTYIVFHIYSISLVGFRYPIHCLPIICILFLPKLKTMPVKNWGVRIFLFFIITANIFPFFIKGDHKISYEGVRLAVTMFDSNRQCESIKEMTLETGEVRTEIQRSGYAFVRCTPYWHWYHISLLCKSHKYKKISWIFNMSINGNPFYTVVNSKNACELNYKLFGENLWINSSTNDHQIVGFPKKNAYYGPYFYPETQVKFDQQSIFLSPMQEALRQNLKLIEFIYFSLGFIVLIIYFYIHHQFKNKED